MCIDGEGCSEVMGRCREQVEEGRGSHDGQKHFSRKLKGNVLRACIAPACRYGRQPQRHGKTEAAPLREKTESHELQE